MIVAQSRSMPHIWSASFWTSETIIGCIFWSEAIGAWYALANSIHPQEYSLTRWLRALPENEKIQENERNESNLSWTVDLPSYSGSDHFQSCGNGLDGFYAFVVGSPMRWQFNPRLSLAVEYNKE
jgi:hypothetical protein